MSSDKILLKWDEFSYNAASSFQALLEDTDFTDVTLASSDGRMVKAHKVVLSSCSPVLKSMLVKSSYASPLLYLRGVSLSQLQTLLTFCYLGQAEVLKSDLEEFLEVARDLAIRGLSQEDTQGQEQGHGKKKKIITAENSKDIGSEIEIPCIKTEVIRRRATFIFTEASNDIVDYSKGFAVESSETYESSPQTNDLFKTNNKENEKKQDHECTSCGKSYSIKKVLNRHVKEKHTHEASFSCSECDWTGPRQYLLVAHMKTVHSFIEQHSTVSK